MVNFQYMIFVKRHLLNFRVLEEASMLAGRGINKAIYVSPTNKEGQFSIDYVKPGTYVVAALEDKNYDLKLDLKNERVSLRSHPIKVGNASFLEQELRLFLTQQNPLV